MSFILHLFHGPAVKTIPEAVAHTDRDASASPDEQKRFAAFVAEVTRAYPNAEEGEDSAWPEGLTPDGHDGRVIEIGGTSYPLTAPRPITPPAPRGLLPGYDDEKEANTLLATKLAAVLAPYGFTLEPSGLVARQVGRVKQGIDIGTMKRDRRCPCDSTTSAPGAPSPKYPRIQSLSVLQLSTNPLATPPVDARPGRALTRRCFEPLTEVRQPMPSHELVVQGLYPIALQPPGDGCPGSGVVAHLDVERPFLAQGLGSLH